MVPLLVVVLLCCTSRAVVTEMTLRPETQTVLAGEETRFTCSTKHPQWGAMIWQVNGKTVLTISQQSGLVPSTNLNITAEKFSSSSLGDGWTLTLKNTQRQQEGEVTCDLQEVNKRTAHLYVQEKGSVRISGASRMALKGHSVEFECQAAGWSPQPTLHWRLNGKEVSSADFNLTSSGTGQGQFSVSSNLSVTASSSCDVHCLASVSAMRAPLSSTVRLTVVAEVVEEDCTVAVALLGSLSALLFLALLCVCTVLCLKRRGRTKPGLQQPIWFNQSESGRISVAGAPQGKVNPGYSSDRDTYFSELIIGPPIPITTSLDTYPDVISSSSQSFQSDSQSEKSSKNVRSITTV